MDASVKIHSNKLFYGFILLANIALLFINLQIGAGIGLVPNLLFIIVGILGLTRPVYELFSDRLEIRNLFGMTLRTKTFQPSELSIVGTSIYLAGKKLLPFVWFLHAPDVRNALAFIVDLQAEDETGSLSKHLVD